MSSNKHNILSARQKLAMFKRWEREVSISKLIRDYGISRKTFYKWKKIYDKNKHKDNILSRLRQKKRGGFRVPFAGKKYYRQPDREVILAVLSLVSQHPEYSVKTITEKLQDKYGPRFIGHHGVQNILKRHNLNYIKGHEFRTFKLN